MFPHASRDAKARSKQSASPEQLALLANMLTASTPIIMALVSRVSIGLGPWLSPHDHKISQTYNVNDCEGQNPGELGTRGTGHVTFLVQFLLEIQKRNGVKLKILEIGAGNGATMLMTVATLIDEARKGDIMWTPTDIRAHNPSVVIQMPAKTAVTIVDGYDILICIHPTPYDTWAFEAISRVPQSCKYLIVGGEIGHSDGSPELKELLDGPTWTCIRSEKYDEASEDCKKLDMCLQFCGFKTGTGEKILYLYMRSPLPSAE
jgi:hypothetical protein